MTKEVLDEREFELVNIIGGDLGANQRDLSRQMSLSLGMTNMLVRRLVSKGFIRISQLNKRKVQYILTPKGFAEKMRKSVKYTFKTIASIGLIKERIKKIIVDLYQEEGHRLFTVLGKSDFALLIEMVFRDLEINDCKIVYIDEMVQEKIEEGVLVICKEDVFVDERHCSRIVDLVHELAKDESLINHIGEKA